MNLERSAIFSAIAIVATVVLVARIPSVADHQALSFSQQGGAYGFYGPCIIRHFSYTWCLNRF
ncbi:MAG: hypothetical protein WCC17_09960 [Candidatus Nitrosopolaris sp.]